ncbi:hypothetical protein HDU76_006556, partial [Blyttiomyces sp. JEL0837]
MMMQISRYRHTYSIRNFGSGNDHDHLKGNGNSSSSSSSSHAKVNNGGLNVNAIPAITNNIPRAVVKFKSHHARVAEQNRELVLNILSAMPSQREAKHYLERYWKDRPDTPSRPSSKPTSPPSSKPLFSLDPSLKPRPPPLPPNQPQPQQQKQTSIAIPQLSQPPVTKSHLGLFRLDAHLPRDQLDAFARSLVQLQRLGLTPVVLLNFDKDRTDGDLDLLLDDATSTTSYPSPRFFSDYDESHFGVKHRHGHLHYQYQHHHHHIDNGYTHHGGVGPRRAPWGFRYPALDGSSRKKNDGSYGQMVTKQAISWECARVAEAIDAAGGRCMAFPSNIFSISVSHTSRELELELQNQRQHKEEKEEEADGINPDVLVELDSSSPVYSAISMRQIPLIAPLGATETTSKIALLSSSDCLTALARSTMAMDMFRDEPAKLFFINGFGGLVWKGRHVGFVNLADEFDALKNEFVDVLKVGLEDFESVEEDEGDGKQRKHHQHRRTPHVKLHQREVSRDDDFDMDDYYIDGKSRHSNGNGTENGDSTHETDTALRCELQR